MALNRTVWSGPFRLTESTFIIKVTRESEQKNPARTADWESGNSLIVVSTPSLRNRLASIATRQKTYASINLIQAKGKPGAY